MRGCAVWLSALAASKNEYSELRATICDDLLDRTQYVQRCGIEMKFLEGICLLYVLVKESALSEL